MSDRFAAHLPPAIRNLPARTRRLMIGAAAAIAIGAAVAIPALLAAAAHPGNAGFTGHTNTVHSVAFSPDGKTLASASSDGTVRLWDVATHRQIGNPLTGYGGGVTSVAFSADGTTLATGSDDHTVRLWDVATHREIGDPIAGRAGPVYSVAFSPDGKTVASGSLSETAQLWDLATHRQIGTPLVGHAGAVYSVAFSPDGKTLASGGDGGTVRLWDLATHRQIGNPLAGHAGAVYSVAFSPDGTTLATGSEGHAVRLWDVATHRQIGGGTTAIGPPGNGPTGACGGPATATGPPANAATATSPPANGTTATTNGLENKSPAQVLRAAVAALGAAQSVHIVGSNSDGPSDDRLGRSSAIGMTTLSRTAHVWTRVVGCYFYTKTDFGPLAGLWRRYPAQVFYGQTLADYAQYNPLIDKHGPLEPKVQQATVNGKKVVVVSWRDDSKLQVANTGPAYPLRADFKEHIDPAVRMVFSEYNVPFDVTAPRNAIDAPPGS